IKTVTGAMTGNVLLAADGAVGLAQELHKNQAAFTEYLPPKDEQVACRGYAKPEPREHGSSPGASGGAKGTQGSLGTGEVRPDGLLEPSYLEYRQSLRTVLANFDRLDAVGGWKNGLFSRDTLEKVAANPNMPGGLRDAARFLLAHPDFRAMLDTAGHGGLVDGLFSLDDVRKALSDVNQKISRFGVRGPQTPASPKPPAPPPPTTGTKPPSCEPRPESPASSPSPCGPARSGVKDIINDPSMSLEEKIEAILQQLMEGMDDEILKTMDDLAAAQDKRAGLSNEKGNEKTAADADRSIERLQMRLQKLVEKRKMMFEMMSTLSMKFHEMAKTALSNMRSA
ncbi:MAG TPA: hypothetical protein VLQ93_03335, partial [Myxococcaceae bacterium]|nr:hypothetical protein [Myxococcaceae bacterium]